MSGDIEGIGAAVTAGLASRAVEPGHGEGLGGKGGPHSRARCLNCGTGLVGSHCHRCGQKADIHRSFGAIGHDLVHAIFHFEGKLWNTLPALAWRPGDLTRRYIHGERASFISPLALFLFAVFLTYAVLSMVGSGGDFGAVIAREAAEQTRSNALKTSFQNEVDRVDARLADTDLPAAERRQLEAERQTLRKSADYLGVARGLSKEEREKGPPVLDDPVDQVMTSANFLSRTKVDTGVPAIDQSLEKAIANPGLLLYKLQANAYKFAWALIPLSLPFMWMLYPFSRRFHTYDHFVFVTYSISFMLLLFVVVRLLNLSIFGDLAIFFAMLYAPFHMYRQLRGAYRASRFGALVRTTLLLFFSLFAVIAFMLLLLAMGLTG